MPLLESIWKAFLLGENSWQRCRESKATQTPNSLVAGDSLTGAKKAAWPSPKVQVTVWVAQAKHGTPLQNFAPCIDFGQSPCNQIRMLQFQFDPSHSIVWKTGAELLRKHIGTEKYLERPPKSKNHTHRLSDDTVLGRWKNFQQQNKLGIPVRGYSF